MEQPAETETAELVERLARYPASRYPAQHATAAFRLATVHLQYGRSDQAVPLLGTAYETFGRLDMRLEQTKALMMHGVALRQGDRNDLASVTFERAARAFGALEQPAEEAAAFYNLGLSLHHNGDPTAAQAALSRAYDLFLAAGHLARAGAAARERGAYLLTSGRIGAARTVLEDAADLAHRANDLPGLGAATNALGLAYLASDDPAAAVREFSRAVGAYPRSLRPAEHAMVKANLAVAYERSGQHARARLTARQALAITSAEPPVRDQAQHVVERLHVLTGLDLLTVLDAEPIPRWPALIREEVLRWCEAPRPERRSAIRGFLNGLLERPGLGYDLAESLLSVIIELPPPPYARMVSSIVQVTAELTPPGRERIHAIIGSAMARFAIPQWQRLAASLNAAEAAAGRDGVWQ